MNTLVQISPAKLAELPSGVALYSPERGYLGRTLVDGVGHVYVVGVGKPWTVRSAVFLGLEDTLTAAAVAAKIVRPWQTARYNDRTLPDDIRLLSNADLSVLERAEMMVGLSAKDMGVLARLAEVAMA